MMAATIIHNLTLLLIHCLMYLRIFVCVGLCFIMYLYVFLLVCKHIDEEENDSCFALIVFLMSCDCKCSVALPHDAVG